MYLRYITFLIMGIRNKCILLIFLAVSFVSTKAQNLSYSCPRDTVLGCGSACMSITARFPDIKSLATDYIVSNVSPTNQCRPYVDPGGAGPSANIVDDDVYSQIINMGFNFVFYGRNYNKLLISPNGVISFDISTPGGYAHYATTAGNLPNTAYDRAIIMGLYHDMDIRETISPNRKIKYNVIGTAPNRKFIVSFYKMPLFYNGNGCNVFFENTHQMICHESSGIIEVHVTSRQPCAAWQNGRGMIGLQDSFKVKSIMAPGRAANDPTWGTVGMNEVWRFIPKDGPTLYRSVQLLDGAGNVVSIGDTTRINNYTFSTTFNNVCPPPGANIYVVKTTYQKIDDPNATFFSLDTINIVRQPGLPLSATSSSSTCGQSTGSITAAPGGGTGPFQYSINGGTLQSSPTFSNLPAGTYSVYAVDNAGCNDTVDVTINAISSLSSTFTTVPTGCPGASNGSITVTPTAGVGPYTFVLDNTVNQTSGTFNNVSAGSHTVVFTDANNCSGTVNVSVTAGTGLNATSTTTSTTCPGASNGSITITVANGTGPYEYSMGSGAYQSSNVFNNVTAGSYLINIRDANNCTGTRTVVVGSGASLTATTTFTPTSCSGVNNGTITITMANGTAPFRFSLDGAPAVNSGNNTYTYSNVASGSHVINISDANNCTTIRAVNVTATTGIVGSASFTPASCPGVNNGTITITTSSGTAPFTFTLDGGTPQTSNVFIGVAAGNHTVVYTDANGCSGSSFLGIPAGTVVTGSAASTPTFCASTADGTVTVTTNNGTSPFTYSIDNGTAQNSNVFSGVTAGSHTISFTDANGCIGTASVTVTSGPGLTVTATPDSTACPGASDGTITVSSNGTGPYSYSIDGGAAQPGNVFNGLTSGNHSILVTDANGCIGGVSSVVPVGTSITGSAGFTDASCAAATNGTVTGLPATGTAPYSYSLDGGPSQANATFTGVAPGNHTVSFTDASGCTASASVTVGFGPDLTGSATSTPTACPGVSDGTVTVTPASGTSPFNYSIDGGPGQTANIFTGIAAGNHSISFTDANGCPGTTSVSVAPGNSITSNIVNGNPPCAFINDGTITINPTSGTGPYEYAINGGAWQSLNVFSNLSPGNYNIDIRNISGCLGTNSTTLTTNTPLAATLSANMPLCQGNSNGSFTVSPAGGVTPYQYSVNGGANYQSSSLFGGLLTGNYQIRIRDNEGCIKDTFLFIDEPPLLTASATSTPASCGGNDGTISISAAGGTPAYSYSVNNGVSYQQGSLFTVADGNYANILIRDINQCLAAASVVVDRIDNMFLDLTPDDTIVCQESSVTIIPQTNAQTNVFSWTSPDAPQSTIANPAAQNAVITPIDTATYILHAVWGVCERWDTILINMLHKPIADAGPDTAICFDRQEASLHGTATNLSGTVNYSWTPTQGVTDPNNQNTDVLINNTTTFTLTVSDNYGCNYNVTDQVVVAKQPPVPAFAGNDTITPTGVPIRLLASGGASYLWSPGSVLDNATSNTPVATIVNDTRFVVIVTDIAGCIGSDTVFVKVYDGPSYYVPNAFSPNGDGLNDVFRPIPVGIVSTEFFRIFNRYGELIFDTNKWLMGWDGNYRGRKQPIGNYIWMIKGTDINGKVIERKGYVLLIR